MKKVNPYKYESSLNDTFILSLESDLNNSEIYLETLCDCFEFILDLIQMQTYQVNEVSLIECEEGIFIPLYNMNETTEKGLKEMKIKPRFITQAKKI